MPTNEERREVAARLRNYANLRESFEESPICGFINALGFGGYIDWKGVCNRIADLIEPEERACRMKKKESKYVLSGWWECDECGIVYPPCNEEIALWALQYCPHCGAKVVQE